MGNRILLHPGDTDLDQSLKMSNGLTYLFINVLVLAGSTIAHTDWDNECTVWLAEHDQHLVGYGTVGFYVSAMPWTRERFAAQHQFVHDMIGHARHHTDWELLGYRPVTDRLDASLAHFARLIDRMDPRYIDAPAYQAWKQHLVAAGISPRFPRCPTHGVLLHWQGCVLCNDDEKRCLWT